MSYVVLQEATTMATTVDRGCDHKIGQFFLAKMTFLCMNGVDIGATMLLLIFFEKHPSGVS
jgi:hypothetical protein